MALMGLWFRVNDKISRLKNLLFNDIQASNEPMIDAYVDMSVYGIIAQVVKRGK